jgi:hypothetical protein
MNNNFRLAGNSFKKRMSFQIVGAEDLEQRFKEFDEEVIGFINELIETSKKLDNQLSQEVIDTIIERKADEWLTERIFKPHRRLEALTSAMKKAEDKPLGSKFGKNKWIDDWMDDNYAEAKGGLPVWYEGIQIRIGRF